jgi:hypothetical protein
MEASMSAGLPFLFAVAALAGIWTIWRAIAANIGAISELKRRAGLPDYGAAIFVTLREQEFGAGDEALSRPRRVRHAARPKPVTHRLHQFARSRSAA